MKRYGKHAVRLDDGTCWAVDGPVEKDGQTLEWILRYGLPDEVYKQRLAIAEVVGSYMALLYKPQKRRNQIVRDLRSALNESEHPTR